MSSRTETPGLWERIKYVFAPGSAGTSREMDSLRLANDQLTAAYDSTVEAWSFALETHKHGTEAHIRRVTSLTVELAHRMSIPADQIAHARRGAMLHDIGEMLVPDAILLKDGPLLPSERAVLRMHPQHAYDMLSPIALLRPALDIPYCHHEKWDGMGYPRGLRGEAIPLCARIFALVDTWDALRSDRSYRPAWSDEQTWQYIHEQVNHEFDPAVVKAFTQLMARPASALATGSASADVQQTS